MRGIRAKRTKKEGSFVQKELAAKPTEELSIQSPQSGNKKSGRAMLVPTAQPQNFSAAVHPRRTRRGDCKIARLPKSVSKFVPPAHHTSSLFTIHYSLFTPPKAAQSLPLAVREALLASPYGRGGERSEPERASVPSQSPAVTALPKGEPSPPAGVSNPSAKRLTFSRFRVKIPKNSGNGEEEDKYAAF